MFLAIDIAFAIDIEILIPENFPGPWLINIFLTNNATDVLNTDIFVNMPITYKYGKDS